MFTEMQQEIIHAVSTVILQEANEGGHPTADDALEMVLEAEKIIESIRNGEMEGDYGEF